MATKLDVAPVSWSLSTVLKKQESSNDMPGLGGVR